MTETFGAWLRAEAVARYGTLRAFAKAIDKEPTYISRWINNHERPSYESARQIADLFGLDVADVLERAGMPIRAVDANPDERPLPPLADVMAVIERDPEIMAQIADIKATHSPDTWRRFVEALAVAWRSNARMQLATWQVAMDARDDVEGRSSGR